MLDSKHKTIEDKIACSSVEDLVSLYKDATENYSPLNRVYFQKRSFRALMRKVGYDEAIRLIAQALNREILTLRK